MKFFLLISFFFNGVWQPARRIEVPDLLTCMLVSTESAIIALDAPMERRVQAYCDIEYDK